MEGEKSQIRHGIENILAEKKSSKIKRTSGLEDGQLSSVVVGKF